MWAIKNMVNGKWLCGTNFRVWPRRQINSYDKALLFETLDRAEQDFKMRHCKAHYKIVAVRLEVFEK